MMPVLRVRYLPRSGALLVALLLLTACGSTPQAPTRPRVPISQPGTTPVTSAQDSSLDSLLARAERADPVTGASLLLEAAHRTWAEGDLDSTEALLGRIQRESLSPLHLEGILLLDAEVLSARNRHAAVLDTLSETRFPNQARLSNSQRIRFHALRATALNATDRVLAGALERIQLDSLLTPEQQRGNHELIWQALATLPANQLEALAGAAANTEIEGWYRLALTSRTWRQDLDRQLVELRNWRSIWPQHPAARIPPREVELAETMARERPRRLALLLPLGTQAGSIVRDAFMSAYYRLHAAGGQVPDIRFYDTGSGTDIRQLHLQARTDGAQMIIGPLLKQDVAALQSVADLGVTTLALNNIEGQAPASPLLYQFALSPESEARQLANRAWRDGHRRAAILGPRDDAGNDYYARKRASFIAEWERLGGQVVAEEIYADNYTDTITELLELDESAARQEALRRLLGQTLQSAQRRRQDIDFIYLMAQPGPARQIVPSLAYLFAGDVPIYASQDVYSGLPRPFEDRDLEGVTFAESPWLLDRAPADPGQIRNLFPQNTAQSLRLQAFGLDAFRLYPRLRLLESSEESRIPGATGQLKLGPNRNIERELSWATIREGLARPLTNP